MSLPFKIMKALTYNSIYKIKASRWCLVGFSYPSPCMGLNS